jgi:hypothetical protein
VQRKTKRKGRKTERYEERGKGRNEGINMKEKEDFERFLVVEQYCLFYSVPLTFNNKFLNIRNIVKDWLGKQRHLLGRRGL